MMVLDHWTREPIQARSDIRQYRMGRNTQLPQALPTPHTVSTLQSPLHS